MRLQHCCFCVRYSVKCVLGFLEGFSFKYFALEKVSTMSKYKWIVTSQTENTHAQCLPWDWDAPAGLSGAQRSFENLRPARMFHMCVSVCQWLFRPKYKLHFAQQWTGKNLWKFSFIEHKKITSMYSKCTYLNFHPWRRASSPEHSPPISPAL